MRRWSRLGYSLLPRKPVLVATGLGASRSTSTGAYDPYSNQSEVYVKYPIVQFPSRTLWNKQYNLNLQHLQSGEFDDMIKRVKESRAYYQYPSLCGPQIGWNVSMFTLFDGSVYINPVNLDLEEWKEEAKSRGMPFEQYEEVKMAELRKEKKTGFAWEPCASCGFMMHYIERPLTVHLKAYDATGKPFSTTLERMQARMALHEMDHLNGVLFYRRVVDSDHVVPLEGFTVMSEWSDDYPSLEARSTNIYTLFVPPYSFLQDTVDDGNLLSRKFEDGVYPGMEHERKARIESAALEEIQRKRWKKEQTKSPKSMEEAKFYEEEQEEESESGEGASHDQ